MLVMLSCSPGTAPDSDYVQVLRDALAATSKVDSFRFTETHKTTFIDFQPSSEWDFSASGTVRSPGLLHKQVHTANHIDPRCLGDPVPCDVARSFEYLSKGGVEFLRVGASDPWVSADSEAVRADLWEFLWEGCVSDRPLEIAANALDRINWNGEIEIIEERAFNGGTEVEKIQITATYCGGAATFRNEIIAELRVRDSLLASIKF